MHSCSKLLHVLKSSKPNMSNTPILLPWWSRRVSFFESNAWFTWFGDGTYWLITSIFEQMWDNTTMHFFCKCNSVRYLQHDPIKQSSVQTLRHGVTCRNRFGKTVIDNQSLPGGSRTFGSERGQQRFLLHSEELWYQRDHFWILNAHSLVVMMIRLSRLELDVAWTKEERIADTTFVDAGKMWKKNFSLANHLAEEPPREPRTTASAFRAWSPPSPSTVSISRTRAARRYFPARNNRFCSSNCTDHSSPDATTAFLARSHPLIDNKTRGNSSRFVLERRSLISPIDTSEPQRCEMHLDDYSCSLYFAVRRL